MSLSDHRVIGYEALLRWQHPERGLLEPEAFLKLAEQTGLGRAYRSVGSPRGMPRSCHLAERAPDDPAISVSVNISALGFGQPDIVRQVAEALQETGLDPYNLRLEITESAAMADAERAHTVLVELKALGVRISLDDFGTGYSSLSYLQRFPVDTLKIDRAFVTGLDEND